MRVNYSNSEVKIAYLNSSFGLRMAHQLLGFNNDIIEAIAGRFTRGKRKGQIRYAIQWRKVVRGGWTVKDGHGFVSYPGTISEIKIVDGFTGKEIYVQ